ncbi:hypothetical protein Tco_0592027, partial [Tanacetum coccineum]
SGGMVVDLDSGNVDRSHGGGKEGASVASVTGLGDGGNDGVSERCVGGCGGCSFVILVKH